MLSHRNDQRDLRFYSILNGFRTLRRSHKNSCGIWLELLLGLLQVRKQRQSNMLSLLAGSDTSHNVRAIGQAVFCIAGSDSACESLVDDSRVLANS